MATTHSAAALAAARTLRERRPADSLSLGRFLNLLEALSGAPVLEILDASDRIGGLIDRERAGQEREGERRQQVVRRALACALDGALFDEAERRSAA